MTTPPAAVSISLSLASVCSMTLPRCFAKARPFPGAGVLLALPTIEKSGVIEIAHDRYGSIGPAFDGLRTNIVALVFLALIRIKRPEALKEHSPTDLGRILGLDHASKMKTRRTKLARLAGLGLAVDF